MRQLACVVKETCAKALSGACNAAMPRASVAAKIILARIVTSKG